MIVFRFFTWSVLHTDYFLFFCIIIAFVLCFVDIYVILNVIFGGVILLILILIFALLFGCVLLYGAYKCDNLSKLQVDSKPPPDSYNKFAVGFIIGGIVFILLVFVVLLIVLFLSSGVSLSSFDFTSALDILGLFLFILLAIVLFLICTFLSCLLSSIWSSIVLFVYCYKCFSQDYMVRRGYITALWVFCIICSLCCWGYVSMALRVIVSNMLI